MKNIKAIIIKISLTLSVLFLMSTSLTAQNNIKLKAENTDEGIKITTTENGETSSNTFDLKDAKTLLNQIGNHLEIDIEEKGDSHYKVQYQIADGESETLEINLNNIMDNINIDVDDFDLNINDLLKEVSSSIKFEETIDSEGNKTINIKKVEEK